MGPLLLPAALGAAALAGTAAWAWNSPRVQTLLHPSAAPPAASAPVVTVTPAKSSPSALGLTQGQAYAVSAALVPPSGQLFPDVASASNYVRQYFTSLGFAVYNAPSFSGAAWTFMAQWQGPTGARPAANNPSIPMAQLTPITS